MSVLVRPEGAISHLTLDRPDKLNALDAAALDQLTAAVLEAGRDPGIRAVVLSGNGRAFCAGGDLDVPDPLSLENTERTADAVTRCISAITSSPRPVVAAVNGPAVGFGVSLALAADICLIRSDAYFAMPFTGVGLMPDGGSTALVAAAVGRPMALRMALLGQRVTAMQALAAGLVSSVSQPEDFDADINTVSQQLASLPADALALTKAAVNASTIGDLPITLARERAGQIQLTASSGFRDAMATFAARSR